MLHKCIKTSCSNEYEDDDLDAYYCPSCKVIKDEAARSVDAKYSTVGHEVVSDLQAFENEAVKVKGPDGRMISFMKVSQ